MNSTLKRTLVVLFVSSSLLTLGLIMAPSLYKGETLEITLVSKSDPRKTLSKYHYLVTESPDSNNMCKVLIHGTDSRMADKVVEAVAVGDIIKGDYIVLGEIFRVKNPAGYSNPEHWIGHPNKYELVKYLAHKVE